MILDWDALTNALDYEVWYGEEVDTLRKLAEQSSTSYDLGLRAAGTTFYWKIVAINEGGRTESELWSFTTTNQFLPDESLGTVGIDWTVASGDSAWFSQDIETHDGTNAMQSGSITDLQESVLQSTIQGPGTLRFWWKVSSETGSDSLNFYVGTNLVDTISGTTGSWVQESVTISNAGPHVLSWIYQKDASGSAGSDCGWLDEVQWESINCTIYPLSGFEGKWVAAYLWDYVQKDWIPLGQEFAPDELVLENLKTAQWYWLCIMELNGNQWEVADGCFIQREPTQ